ncbi:translation initiation factor [Planctomicrobium sp. SH668]|uniref:translation initiation factor n=1 Tax=Planctomicrobium sp. SH668 TaxID=3448126 RepID=UPI003F5AFCEB
MGLFAGTPFDRPPHCERCEKLESECTCPSPVEERTPPQKQKVRLQLEIRKGKKQITTIRGLADEGTHLTDVLSQLKNTCGAGGSLQCDVLELQGDQRERCTIWLKNAGYQVR